MGLKPYLNGRPTYIPAKETRIFDYLPKEHLEVADKNGWIAISMKNDFKTKLKLIVDRLK